jgi:hypothetical protein
MKPTFTAKFLSDGATAFRCIQTGVRYIVTSAGREFAAYREGQLMRTGKRHIVVDAIELDAKWGLRA